MARHDLRPGNRRRMEQEFKRVDRQGRNRGRADRAADQGDDGG